MPKHHPYSRIEFRRHLRAWLKRNFTMVAAATAGLVALLALVTVLLHFTLPATPFRSWLIGVLQTGAVAAYLHLFYASFLAHDPVALSHVRGAWGEDNTRDELQRALRRKVVWGWVDSLALQYGDIDHLVVTREGGLVAIDSKWRGNLNDGAEMARAARKVQLRAEALTRDLLKGRSRGTRRAKVNPLSITAVVVLWGPAQHVVAEGTRVDDIEFIAGRELVGWLTRLEGEPVSRDAALDILRSWHSRRDQTDKARASLNFPRTTD